MTERLRDEEMRALGIVIEWCSCAGHHIGDVEEARDESDEPRRGQRLDKDHTRHVEVGRPVRVRR